MVHAGWRAYSFIVPDHLCALYPISWIGSEDSNNGQQDLPISLVWIIFCSLISKHCCTKLILILLHDLKHRTVAPCNRIRNTQEKVWTSAQLNAQRIGTIPIKWSWPFSTIFIQQNVSLSMLIVIELKFKKYMF